VYGNDTVNRAPAVQHQIAGRQLHRPLIVSLADNELATIIVSRIAQKERCREVGSYPERSTRHRAHSPVDVSTVRLPPSVSIEQRGQNTHWQRRTDKQRVLIQLIQDDATEPPPDRVTFRQLLIVLGPAG
jgi:hypothetical protein